MATTISISGLVKTFGPTRALDGLDLEVRTGEVHGFLGPNGAGKTTTLRVLLGLLRADAGTADVVALTGGGGLSRGTQLAAFTLLALAFAVSPISCNRTMSPSTWIGSSGTESPNCNALPCAIGGDRDGGEQYG